MSSYRKCLQKTEKRDDLKLCPRGYCTAKHKFDVYPSAYANGYAVQVCKGTKPDFRGRQQNDYQESDSDSDSDLTRWFKEEWIDVCQTSRTNKHVPCGRSNKSKRPYPYCRPLKKSPSTPVKSYQELTPREIKKMCQIKKEAEKGERKHKGRKPNRVYLDQIAGGKKHMPNMKLVNKYNRLKDKQKSVKYNGEKVCLYRPFASNRSKKKLQVYVEDPNSSEIVNVHFGHTDYEDYTLHRNSSRRENYCARSRGMCEKYGCDVTSANFWSRMVLWNCSHF